MISILINATSCPQGGSVQVAIGFIREALRQAPVRGWKLTLAVLPPVAKTIDAEVTAVGVRMEVFGVRPGSLFKGRQSRSRLKALTKNSDAKLVFTVLGPAYVRFDVPEIMGFADPFAVVPQRGGYSNYPALKIPLIWLVANSKRLLIRSSAHYWIETEAGKRGMISRAGIPEEKITVVPNGVNELFAKALLGGAPEATGDMLVMGAGYPHKNHRLLPAVARLLEARLPKKKWRFVVTLPDDAPAWLQLRTEMDRAGLSKRVINRGVLTLAQCAEAYEESTLIFHPSLLEVFSAGYVEAMAARRPLLVSDRSFSREICADAAAYFEPTDPASAADCIEKVLTDEALRHRLVAAGIKRLKTFPDAAAKNGKLCDLISEQLHRISR